ncbi:GBF-interacting protein 1 [Hibiscus syriacus]|uniref:GBF-interacting protein 1 n=1 Tax=Hibiscus syriacus TaxID=106335 RepID=A0A6A2ZH39_HIBSY|nr:GBF-interacting protein 1 [Hibiscus syriacus]
MLEVQGMHLLEGRIGKWKIRHLLEVQPDVVELSATIPATSFASLIRGQEKSTANSNGSSSSSTCTTVSSVYSSASDPVAAEQVKQSKPMESTLLEVVTSEVATLTVKADPQLLADSNASKARHVTFPTHFHVSENGLTFGSFHASFGLGTKHNNATSAEITSGCPVESFLGSDEPTREPSSTLLHLGIKFPLPQFKLGTNAGNAAHFTIPSGYGPLPPPVGFNVSVPPVTPENEGSVVWMAAPGQDLSNLPVNPLYNVSSLHGQHLPFSPAQAGHGAIAGLYQSSQTLAPNVNTLLQQPQAMAAATAEATFPASGAYQQPQLTQINRNTNY